MEKIIDTLIFNGKNILNQIENKYLFNAPLNKG